METSADLRVFQRSLHGMVLADDARQLHEVNHAACVIVQRPQEVLLRSRIDDLTAPVALPTIEDTWREMLALGALHGRWPLVTGDQRLVEVEYSSIARARDGLHLIVFVTHRMPAREAEEAGGHGAPLTDRESEVLRLLALGYTGPEIAKHLVVGLDTVRTHIRHLKRKLGARTLPHLVALGLSHQK